ncbi:endoprotease bli-4 [Lepeophtheirus salmonis]|uniref:endoprotease bli-4 n=1 Tax=Lepeophtheirus salmonis TaxID=72036 RepID=UPI001AE2639A|nr:endoprotease bli-4-like [Lepeophtheirus salmonis]
MLFLSIAILSLWFDVSIQTFMDPLWKDSWHLRNDNISMNIQDAWSRGLSGKGVRVLFLDDGIDRYHPDLYTNYKPELSYDFVDNDDDPIWNRTLKNSHGTKMSGIVGSEGNNSFCGLGIAFHAQLGMARIFNKNVRFEHLNVVRALTYKKDLIDIYTIAVGPQNMGVTLDNVPEEINEALKETENGRGGKGSVVLLAVGNGGANNEACSFGSNVQSIHTIAVNAVGEGGDIPDYAEPCGAVMTSAFGSSKPRGRGIVTTTVGGNCVGNFSGTSSSTAVATGVIALVLEANPNLTWRDVQHLVMSSVVDRDVLDDKANWKRNAAGIYFSEFFGFGLMDAGLMTRRANEWIQVPTQIICEYKDPQENKIISEEVVELSLSTDSCDIQYLEHVQLQFTAYSLCRGNINLRLESPSGTLSNILRGRETDFSTTGFNDWRLLSLQYWGESSKGKWRLRVFKSPCINRAAKIIAFKSWKLILYGTKEMPASLPISNNNH